MFTCEDFVNKVKQHRHRLRITSLSLSTDQNIETLVTTSQKKAKYISILPKIEIPCVPKC